MACWALALTLANIYGARRVSKYRPAVLEKAIAEPTPSASSQEPDGPGTSIPWWSFASDR